MHLVRAGVGGDGSAGTGQWLFLVIGGTNPWMLFLLRRMCVQGVSQRDCLVVGLGAAMMAGASATRVRGVGMSVVGMPLSTLWATLWSGVGIWVTLWGLLGGSIHLWSGVVNLRLSSAGSKAANFFLTRVRKHFCLSGFISLIVVTNSSMTSCKCLFHIKNGTWQCCGKSSAEPEMWYARVSGTKTWLQL